MKNARDIDAVGLHAPLLVPASRLIAKAGISRRTWCGLADDQRGATADGRCGLYDVILLFKALIGSERRLDFLQHVRGNPLMPELFMFFEEFFCGFVTTNLGFVHIDQQFADHAIGPGAPREIGESIR